ncbi:MAG: hypothetical protein G3I11_02745 [Ferrovum sp.]|nr:hypothetical protein [Ferrovum sp.]
MNTTLNPILMSRWNNHSYELFPLFRFDEVILNEKPEQVIHALEWSCIEQFVPAPAPYKWVE